jgi:polysaccharide deacetylase family protein (PEP-CTERM system associated)
MSASPHSKRHLLTVALEDYFQVGAFKQVIQTDRWYRFETRLERNTHRTLELLDQYDVKATFFVIGWIADRFPELVRKVIDHGHEVASKGYYHESIRQMSREQFKEDALRSREALEHACGKKILGYRMAHQWLRPCDLWALDILTDIGFSYDSSLAPLGTRFSNQPWRRYLHKHKHHGKEIWELPISSTKCFGLQVPIGGGNYLRQLPSGFIRRAVQAWAEHQESPLVLYFHAWELDPDQPKINSGSWLNHLRHYRNLDRMQSYLEYFFQRYSFTNIADYLGLSTEPELSPEDWKNRSRLWTPEPLHVRSNRGQGESVSNRPRTPVSVVIPCYNEEPTLPYLANTLKSVEKELSRDYQVTFVMVNDGSTDSTWEMLNKFFGNRPGYQLIQHECNKGVAAAIMTGIRASRTEIVCSMDADCTYDPHELQNMIPMLKPGVDLVTASPYHPEGMVRNVPGWRLKLSKSASWMYRRVLHEKLYTYTSCFRVYRRSSVVNLEVKHNGYLGVAELLGQLDLKGAKIVEFPAVLEVRTLGRSKMKTVRTILGHMKLMTRLFAKRGWNWLTRKFASQPQLQTQPVVPTVVFEKVAIELPNLPQPVENPRYAREGVEMEMAGR